MGRIIDKIKEDSKNLIFIKSIQKLTFETLDKLFQEHNISNIKIEYEIGTGERGNYEDEENHLLKINFDYIDLYTFEFYLYYDQLEFYILKNLEIVGKCNLEDYTEDENEMVATFIKYLKRTLIKLEVPFNE
ncbi:hypothetical protein [Flavobacterium sp. RSP15]|uniref:hypothetical protein n=1 Tax=Flavobacterium sp. RSP15 TaxID=2497485 RepID=UPI000F83A1AF|nr:hypothetical protein [Flavobacterium sp. RSP15]RTY85519.1 hypothetical protein EKM00_14250 [Flavobacterium sp. RSP15]